MKMFILNKEYLLVIDTKFYVFQRILSLYSFSSFDSIEED